VPFEWPDGSELEYFSPLEFDHPELMDMSFMRDLDRLRMRCGFAITITDDARLPHDMARLYGSNWPDSAHLYQPASDDHPEYLVRAVDLKPASAQTKAEREAKEMEIAYQALTFWKEDRWPAFQLEVATRHLHLDDYVWPGRRATRPNIFPGVSK